MAYSRREFLQQAGATAAAAAVAHVPLHRLWAATPAELLPEPTDALLRALAQLAVDEARRAGAAFADVRIGGARSVALKGGEYFAGSGGAPTSWPRVKLLTGFGVRAVVDGAWGFTAGHILTPEAVAGGARAAVEAARANRPRHRRALELAPAPTVENGFWEMPIEQDPFAVPLLEQHEACTAVLAQLASMPKIILASIGLEWRKVTTVFASTEGSLILQRLATAMPRGSVTAVAAPDDWGTMASARVRSIRVGPYGYEALGVSTLAEGVRDAAERAIAAAEAGRATTSVDVGRYEIVFGAGAVSSLLTATVAAAVHLPRALGYEANGAGTSFAAPPGEMLGRFQVAAPIVTLHGDRTRAKGAATVGWDDEGVKPDAYTYVKDGIITDYHTDRQTAPEIGGWYRARGEPMRAHGLARGLGGALPAVRLPNLSMEPGRTATDLGDLIAGTKRGFYVERCGGIPDQQLINTQFGAPRSHVRRIVNGRLGEYVSDFAFQFITQSFWKSVTAIGGPASAQVGSVVTDSLAEGDASQSFPYSTVSVVPMHVRNVNVLNTGRTA